MVFLKIIKQKNNKDMKKEKSTGENKFILYKKSNKKANPLLEANNIDDKHPNTVNNENNCTTQNGLLKNFFRKKFLKNKNWCKSTGEKRINIIKRLMKSMSNFIKNNCYEKCKKYCEIIVNVIKRYYNRFKNKDKIEKIPLLKNGSEDNCCIRLNIKKVNNKDEMELDINEIETTGRIVCEYQHPIEKSDKLDIKEVCITISFYSNQPNESTKRECIKDLKETILKMGPDECDTSESTNVMVEPLKENINIPKPLRVLRVHPIKPSFKAKLRERVRTKCHKYMKNSIENTHRYCTKPSEPKASEIFIERKATETKASERDFIETKVTGIEATDPKVIEIEASETKASDPNFTEIGATDPVFIETKTSTTAPSNKMSTESENGNKKSVTKSELINQMYEKMNEEINQAYEIINMEKTETDERIEMEVDAIVAELKKIEMEEQIRLSGANWMESKLYYEIDPYIKLQQTVGYLPPIPEVDSNLETSDSREEIESEPKEIIFTATEKNNECIVNIAKDPPERVKKNKRSPINKNKPKSPKWKLIKTTLYSPKGNEQIKTTQENDQLETERYKPDILTSLPPQETVREEYMSNEPENKEFEPYKEKYMQLEEDLLIKSDKKTNNDKEHIIPNIEIYNLTNSPIVEKYENINELIYKNELTPEKERHDFNYLITDMCKYTIENDLFYNGVKESFESIKRIKLSYFHPLFTLRGPIIIENNICVGVRTEYDEIYFKLPKIKFKNPNVNNNINEPNFNISGPCFINKLPKGKAISIDGEIVYFDLPVFPSYYWYYDYLFSYEELLINKDGLSIDLFPIRITNLYIINGIKSEATQALSEIFLNFTKLSIHDQVRLASILGTEELDPFIAVDIHISYAFALKWTELDWGSHLYYYKKNYNALPKSLLLKNGFDPEKLNLLDPKFIQFSNNNAMLRKKLLVENPVYNYSPIHFRLEHRNKTEYNRVGHSEKINLRFKLIPKLHFPYDKPATCYGTVDELVEFKHDKNVIRVPFGYNYEFPVWNEMKKSYEDYFTRGHINTLYKSQSKVQNDVLDISTSSKCICEKLERPCPYTSIVKPSDFVDPSNFLKVYGDPLGELRGKGSNGISSEIKLKDIDSSGEETNNINGNWTCEGCKNINFPKRMMCNKCGIARNELGTKCVKEYANLVHKELIKIVSNHIHSSRHSRRNRNRRNEDRTAQHEENSSTIHNK